ncbi:hypothetical protein [Pseudomonas amygdali]|uniref:Uncharacterized protein n=2 Tax=Pseudomonas amygdali pv. lachrymans TaxID=53707 RepID=A0ABR5KQF5_PSEAV|nr:hypothetical protein [Pseudomonas amygdali]AXH59471.1 hypothetical protein PLA107_030050 [Pseudomonas amygdali pv. lachrymans str. M301315]KPC16900.1 Uncharacterized protein AC499_0102 [Pseudomonas amygdali pv. lachrymans]KPC17859.1 Uncharacterized protein AC499_1061 [Pseudomonas amygdali pv. lachrymans]RMT06186.1 hypothetical protein ALP54_03400 [Pseudomonas amygdali pv. lachrymans]
MIHRKSEIDKRLQAKTPFWKGLWLMARLAGRFIWSLGPHNWSIQKLATAGKEDPLSNDLAKETSTSTMNTLK